MIIAPKRSLLRSALTFITFLFVGLQMGCQTLYYNFWETFGVEKRDLLRDQISAAQDTQIEIREEFKDTLERIRKEYPVAGGKLAETYDLLSADYEQAQTQAEDFAKRIEKIDRIAEDLFAEWESEAQTIKNRRFRQDSLAKLKATKLHFKQMQNTMHQTEKRLQPVLMRMRDQVLYLKHNLNALALDALKTEMQSIEDEIELLIRDLKRSIEQTQKFSESLA